MEKEISKFKLYATIISLGFTGGAIFIIPYIKFVFYDLQLQVTGMTNTQSALLLTVYTIVTIIIMIPSGALVDKIDVKKGLIIALVGTTAVTALYAFTFTSYATSLVIWAILSFLTMGIYWPSFSKILNVIGAKTDKTGSGRSGLTFGFYYACNGIAAAIINSISLWASTQFEDPIASFRIAVIVAGVSTLIATVLVFLFIDRDLITPTAEMTNAVAGGETVQTESTISIIAQVIKNPMSWMVALIVLVGYTLYSLQGYFTPYLTTVVGISPESAGIFAIIRTYVFLVLAAVGGFMADKVFKSTARWLGVAFAIMAVVVAGFFVMPSGVNIMFISAYTLLPSAFVQMTYTIKYSVINEIDIKPGLLATTTSAVTFCANLVDLVFSPAIARLIDTKGAAAYNYLFGFLILMLIIGSFASFTVVAKRKKNKAA
ncbi:MAG: hypothetical protein DBX38_03420 [Eubacteriales Family XIII. Incertae Sedis bacterium]|nr:MAG: hypothetical protein DBX38_03420 [Clostridiales Family XIII bacterium]